MNTEINLHEPFGIAIYKYVIEYNCCFNLEIGSWDGEGSTYCFVQAMERLSEPMRLDCVEIVTDKWNALKKKYHKEEWVYPIHNSSISYDNFLPKKFDDVWDSPYNKIPYPKEMVRGWYDRDVAEIQKYSGALENECNTTYDSVLIDGSEFTGYSEYRLLMDRNQIKKILFLDDVHKAYKCHQVYQEMLKNPQWFLIEENPDARNGFAIFVKNEL